MPNTGEVQRKGFKQEIFMKKLKEFEKRQAQSSSHCRKHHLTTSPFLKAELVYRRYSPVQDFKAMRQERLRFPKLQRGGQKRKITSNMSPLFQQQRYRPSEGEAPHTIRRNKMAPFSTLGKPTCGFNFSRDTDNKKKDFGIMPSNLVKWRSNKHEKATIR